MIRSLDKPSFPAAHFFNLLLCLHKMKFLHISDLHFGKVIHGVSMLENGDQPFWTDRFLELAEVAKELLK